MYVNPTTSYNPDCPSDHQCHTLQYYFSNNSFTERSVDLKMIFLTGQHAGICKTVTVLKSTSLCVVGVGQGVKIDCTNIILEIAATIKFTNVTLDNWYILCPHPPAAATLVVQMSVVIAQNHTVMNIQHAPNKSGNFIVLRNSIFSLSGSLSFIDSSLDNYIGAITLVSSTLNIKRNSTVVFSQNKYQYGALFLNLSALNIENDVNLTFSNNIKGMGMFSSSLNVSGRTHVTFISNSESVAQSQMSAGIMIAFNSTLSFENGVDIAFMHNVNTGGGAVLAMQMCALHVRKSSNVAFISNGADQSALYALNSTLNIEDDTNVIFHDNTGRESTGAMTLFFSALNIGCEASIIFTNNKMQKKGGPGALVAHNSRINIKDSVSMTFIGNNGDYGGALALRACTVNITNKAQLVFSNNTGNEGGAIALYPTSIMNIKNEASVIFSDNVALDTGGALLLMSSTLYIMHNTRIQFTSNSALYQAGAIQAQVNSNIDIADYAHVTFSGNSAQISAAICVKFSTFSMRNSSDIVFTSNRASMQCGGFWLQNSIINVENNARMNFIDNKASKVGAVGLMSSEFNVRHNATLFFINNKGDSQHGAIGAEISTINVENYANISFINNSAYAVGAIGLWSSKLNVRDNIYRHHIYQQFCTGW